MSDRYPAKFKAACEALEKKLYELFGSPEGHAVSVYAQDAEHFRIAEISLHYDRGGCAYQRSDPDVHVQAMILAAEDFVLNFETEPFRPEGWSSDIDERADAIWKLEDVFKQMSKTAEAA